MNLTKLFETQKVLRDRINYNEPDRFNKLVLALLVELGECANEWRGFKFWSQDQKARTSVYENINLRKVETNPLLEEYVDGLHFVLELGIELGFENTKPFFTLSNVEGIEGFTAVYRAVVMLEVHQGFNEYHRLLLVYIRLGVSLGFTWEKIEQAYFEKNKVNHIRQDSGY